jgi:hypothetical protein
VLKVAPAGHLIGGGLVMQEEVLGFHVVPVAHWMHMAF